MPLRHMVLIELKPETSKETIKAAVTALRALPAQIDAIRSYEVVVDVGLQEGNASLGVIALFDDVDGWRTYGPHPAHQAALRDHIAPIALRRTALQGEATVV